MANLVVHFEIHASPPKRLIDFYLLDPDGNVFGFLSPVLPDGTNVMDPPPAG